MEFWEDILQQITKYYNNVIDIIPKIGLAIIALLIAWVIAKKAKDFAGNRLKNRMHDPLLAIFISRLVKSIVLILGLLVVLRIVGLTGIAASLLAGAGISAFIIGFALKDIGENFLAGIILAFKRPFSIGDIIESEGIKGKVISLNLRDTEISWSGKNIYLPNAMLINNPLTNYTRKNLLSQDLIFAIEYGSDYQRALKAISKVLEDMDGILEDDEHSSSVLISDISTNAVKIDVYYWVQTDNEISYSVVKSNVIIKILQVLEKEGFKIPSNIVEIKNIENLIDSQMDQSFNRRPKSSKE